MTISLSVRCTREEYLAHCYESAPRPMAVALIGVILLAIAAAARMISGVWSQMDILLLLVGAVLTITPSLLLPILKKGEGGRRYDASDSLSQAMSLVITEESVTLKSATTEGTLPLSAVTKITDSKTVKAIAFTDDVEICIPHRALTDEESAALDEILKPYR